MVLARVSLTDAVLHQTRQRRKYRDRRINSLTVQVPVQNDLTLCDITRKIRNRMRDIIIRHGQNRDLCDRTLLPGDDTCTLIERSQIRIHVTRIALSRRNLSLR